VRDASRVSSWCEYEDFEEELTASKLASQLTARAEGARTTRTYP
jgi:hypothetical protein